MYFNAWGSGDAFNTYIGWAAKVVQTRYGVTVKHVKISDAADVVKRVQTEMAAKRGLSSATYSGKGFYYLGGLTESAETMATFTAMCLAPDWFGLLAYGFAALCALTTVTRIVAGIQVFRPD